LIESAAAPEEAQALASCCQALGLDATPAQLQALSTYLDLLERWNATYNLTAVRDRAQMRGQHLADCLAVIPSLVRYAQAQGHPGPGLSPSPGAQVERQPLSSPIRVLDVGSGGGLPGVLIALFQPEWQVTCVDAVGKKTAFIQQVAGRLALPNLRALHSRVEAIPAGNVYPLITARAFSSLADLVRLTQPLLAQGGAWVAMKGRLEEGELAQLDQLKPAGGASRAVGGSPSVAQVAHVFHVEQLTVPGLEAQRCLVWMKPGPAPAHTATPMP
jgi:16S rRNA (guanine527-N7)-methyltransferase